MIADVLRVYSDEHAVHKKSARNISYVIGSLLKWWGDKTVADINQRSCREYSQTKTLQAAAADLKFLRAAVGYWHEHETYGPLNFIPKFWRPAANPPKERWLTREEAAKLVCASRKYQHMKRFVLLGLYTGSRPGITLALKWDQVDLRNKTLKRLPDGAAEDEKKRAPKIRLGRRILSHLKRWHRMDGGKGFICRYEGPYRHSHQVKDPHAAWDRIVEASGLQGVTRHTLRHTRATWMMNAGVPIWEAAGYLGMTVKTLERIYGHHSPDHQERAANV